jgi:signal transduction histidine kinase
LDVGLFVLVAGICVAELATGQVAASVWRGVLLTAGFALPMLGMRRSPWVALVVVYATMVLSVALGVSLYNFIGSVVPGVAVVGVLAARSALVPSLVGLVVAYVSLMVTALVDPGGYLWGGFILGAGWVAGRLIRSRQLLIDRLNATAAELERSRDAQAQLAVGAERARLARELHDVVAHSVSVMVVQAGAAERMVAVDPQRAQAALESVRATGRQALDELRVLLGVLRPGASAGAAVQPAPRLADLDALMEPLRAQGLEVQASTDGQVRELSPGLELTAYRIVQESLTNILRHAHARRAWVALEYAADALDIRVADDGRGGAPLVGGTGRGLAGMTARAQLYGGTVASGDGPEGGFVVTAHLPLSGPS